MANEQKTRWTPDEDNTLIEQFGKMPVSAMVKLLPGRSEGSIGQRRIYLRRTGKWPDPGSAVLSASVQEMEEPSANGASPEAETVAVSSPARRELQAMTAIMQALEGLPARSVQRIVCWLSDSLSYEERNG